MSGFYYDANTMAQIFNENPYDAVKYLDGTEVTFQCPYSKHINPAKTVSLVWDANGKQVAQGMAAESIINFSILKQSPAVKNYTYLKGNEARYLRYGKVYSCGNQYCGLDNPNNERVINSGTGCTNGSNKPVENKQNGGGMMAYNDCRGGLPVRNSGTSNGYGDAYFDIYNDLQTTTFELKKSSSGHIEIYPKTLANSDGTQPEMLSFSTKSYNNGWDWFTNRLVGVPASKRSGYTDFNIVITAPFGDLNASQVIVRLKNASQNWYVGNNFQNKNGVGIWTSATNQYQTAFWMIVKKPNALLEKAYWKKMLNNIDNTFNYDVFKQNHYLANLYGLGLAVNCCTGNYKYDGVYISADKEGERLGYKKTERSANGYDIKGIPIGGDVDRDGTPLICSSNSFLQGTSSCDKTMSTYCKIMPDDPICGCDPNGTVLKNGTDLPLQVKSFPQCFLNSCTDRNAYKNRQQQDRNTGAVNCPTITNCNQYVNMKDEARINWSRITQNCQSSWNNKPTNDKPSGGNGSKGKSPNIVTLGLGIILLCSLFIAIFLLKSYILTSIVSLCIIAIGTLIGLKKIPIYSDDKFNWQSIFKLDNKQKGFLLRG